jgi:hypothetical protein
MEAVPAAAVADQVFNTKALAKKVANNTRDMGLLYEEALSEAVRMLLQLGFGKLHGHTKPDSNDRFWEK